MILKKDFLKTFYNIKNQLSSFQSTFKWQRENSEHIETLEDGKKEGKDKIKYLIERKEKRDSKVFGSKKERHTNLEKFL